MKSEIKKTVAKRELTGTVVSASMAKTAVVNVERRKAHPIYKKYYRVSKKYHVHDEKGIAKVGDVVRFSECRPLSKTKRWRLIEVVKK